MKTTGNTIFISGGSAGIGFAIAKKLSDGNNIIINGRNQERLQRALAELHNAIAIQGDLSLESDRIRIANELKNNHPEVNIIINNAGFAYSYRLDQTTNVHEKALQEINTNYIAIIHFTELMLPHLLQKETAAIVNISSIAAYRSHPLIPTYSASKAALHGYTTALRASYTEHPNLHVFEVFPPLVNTDFSNEIGGKDGIPPSEVADELYLGLEKNQVEIPVGMTKKVTQVIHEAMAKLS
ncbi:SDR family oxidoreductase [Rhizosphaericola mali]|uniref:SDR family NAD(P)-dependent oxidoreductase n=1 Tax=Rhizosphaericola mali TaxID=2545455 RepID=A0A5P2G7R7_9BACT|nr:SDR family NAD(P)-dependent oxidoreductase [Rhizosphaericola mali]QES87561.1 SDR family NAD(P)-dependent oxidoreductase [Rhizosphaericola mali]